jgi:GYF domain 2
MDWYVQMGERQLGPLSEDALRAMAASGQIGPDTLLWRAGNRVGDRDKHPRDPRSACIAHRSMANC